jgi:hypothetical protein
MRRVVKRGLVGVAAVAVATVGVVGASPASAETIDAVVHVDTDAPLGVSLCITIFDSRSCTQI